MEVLHKVRVIALHYFLQQSVIAAGSRTVTAYTIDTIL